MSRNWYGKRIYDSDDRWSINSKRITDSDIRREKIKIVIYFLIATAYFYFIILGRTI